ncbi:MAG: hypothetical protein ACKVZJ_15385 [Phycisphaerales bacterium]
MPAHLRTSPMTPPFRLFRLGLMLAVVLVGAIFGGRGAVAAPFALLVIDNGGQPPGTLGGPIQPTQGSFFVSKMASPMGTPPSPEAIAERPVLEFSSYAAMGGMPSSTGSRANSAAFNLAGPPFSLRDDQGNAVAMIGVRASFPIAVSDPEANPLGGAPALSQPGPLNPDSVFVARLVMQRGSVPVGPSVFLGAVFTETGECVSAMATLDGPSSSWSCTCPHPTGKSTRSLLLRSHLAAQVEITGFGPADVYDLYVTSEAPPRRPEVQAGENKKVTKQPKAKKPKPAKKLKGRGKTRVIRGPMADGVTNEPAPVVPTVPIEGPMLRFDAEGGTGSTGSPDSTGGTANGNAPGQAMSDLMQRLIRGGVPRR